MKLIMRFLNHMVTWSVVMLLGSHVAQSPGEMVLFSLIGASIAALGCFARLKIKSLLWFVVVHFLAATAVIFGVGMLYGNPVFAILLILSILWSALLSLHPAMEWMEEPKGIYVGTCVVMYVLSVIYDMPSYVGTWCVVATIFLYLNKLLFEKFEAADRFIEFGSLSSKIDTTSVRSLCKKMILIYVGMMTVVMTVLGFIGIDGVWEFIGKILYKFLQFLGQFLPKGEPPVEPQQPEMKPQEVPKENIFESMAQENQVMQTIGEIFFGIVKIFTILVFIFVIVVVISEMIQRFGKKKEVKEERLIREKLYVGKEKKTLRKDRGFKRQDLSAAKKVRKIYKRNMTRQEEKYVRRLPYQNPDEQLETVSRRLANEDAREEIREIYERARYSEEHVTEADVKRIHRLM